MGARSARACVLQAVSRFLQAQESRNAKRFFSGETPHDDGYGQTASSF